MIIKRMLNLPEFNYTNYLNEFNQISRQMNLISNSFFQREAKRSGHAFPLVNLTEDKDNYYLKAELPGVKSENIEIQTTDTSISLAGERKISTENNGTKYHRRERESGKFSRILSLSNEIDSEKVEANLKNGVLKVILPKAEKAKPRQITIN